MAYRMRRWPFWAIGFILHSPPGLAQPPLPSLPQRTFNPAHFTFSRPLPPVRTPGTNINSFHISFQDSDSGSDPSEIVPPSIVCPQNVFLDAEKDGEFSYLDRQQYYRRGSNLRDFCFRLGCFCDRTDSYTVSCPDPENRDDVRYPMLDHCEESCECLSRECCSDSD